ncbi:MAG: peptide deformylase [Brachymonas sp.]|nr:peptide deformylase [Brachymonas sp.]
MSSPQILPILHYPDPRLHKVAKPVDLAAGVPKHIQALIANMLTTMYDAQGIGLAATQVDVHERLIVIDVSEERNAPIVLINPNVTWASAEKQKGDEGCLSVPGIYDGVERSTSVKVSAADEHGQVREISADGLLAVCMQHEMDHLMGKVFVEYLSPLKRTRIKSKMAKLEREESSSRK